MNSIHFGMCFSIFYHSHIVHFLLGGMQWRMRSQPSFQRSNFCRLFYFSIFWSLFIFQACALRELKHPYICGYREFFVEWDKEVKMVLMTISNFSRFQIFQNIFFYFRSLLCISILWWIVTKKAIWIRNWEIWEKVEKRCQKRWGGLNSWKIDLYRTMEE